jgi:hypothetical protein
LDVATGVISGTPTAPYSTATVVITATGASSGSATSTISFTVLAKPVVDTTTAIAIVPMVAADNTYVAELPGTAANIPVSIVIPAGATGIEPTSFGITASAVSSDSYTVFTLTALKVSDSAAVTSFEVPLQLTIPQSVADSATVASGVAGTWTAIPLIPSSGTTLGTSDRDGYYISGGNIVILTRHLTSFGYRKDQAPVSLAAASTSVTAGGTVVLTAGGGSGTIAYSYTSSTTGICTVSGTGVVTSIAAGTCSVTATNAANGEYLDKTSSAVTITVNAVVTTATTTDTSAADKAAADKLAAEMAAAAKLAAEKAAAEAAAKALVDKLAAEKLAAEAKAAADKLAAEAAAKAAEEAAAEAAIVAAEKKAAANTVKISSSTKATKLTLDLADKYWGRIAYVQVVTKTKTGTKTTTLDYFVIDNEQGTASISVKKLAKGQKLQVRIGKTIVFSKTL